MNSFGVILLMLGLALLVFALTPRGRDTFSVATGLKRAV